MRLSASAGPVSTFGEERKCRLPNIIVRSNSMRRLERRPALVEHHGEFAELGSTASVLFVGWMLYSSQHKDARPMTAPDKEEFHTTAFLAPSIESRPRWISAK